MSETLPKSDSPPDLNRLVAEHQANVWRYLRYLGADPTDAEDLTQETFLAIARASFVESSERETAHYLRTVARNQLLMLRRKQGREISTVELDAAEAVWRGAIDGQSGLDRFHAALADCLAQLEGRARAAIDGFYRDRKSREELAVEFEMKPEGVKTLLRRTREILRNCIEKKV